MIDIVTTVDDELVAAFARLIPQLSKAPPPDRTVLEALVAQPGCRLLVARDAGRIIGTLALTLYRIPTGLQARIDDVVVDDAGRGKGIGEALSRRAIELAREAGAKNVTLTSRPSREAANRLYVRLGFQQIETNVYRYLLSGVLLLVVLAAGCGRSEQSERKRVVADDPEERCDPKETRVCVGTRVVACEDGKLGRALRQCSETCRKGKCVGSCAEGAELIYVVDSSNQLMSFDPRKLPGDPFRLVGVMSCDTVGSPFSMSVDRSGTAWVLYTSGDIFEVSTLDATCRPSGYVQNASPTFGMGFVTDEPGGKAEKLYIAANDGSHGLLTIDTSLDAPRAKSVATLQYTQRHPELTGTSEAKLFGFFPASGEPSFVQEIDRKTGALVGTQWQLGDPLDYVQAYAFAHWGGVFYIFVSSDRSTVRSVDRKTGAYQLLMDNLPSRIVGAGVSTCAPEKDGAKSSPGPA